MPDEVTKETRDPTEKSATSEQGEPAAIGESADDVSSLAPNVAVGCSDLPPGLRRKRYFQRLRYLDIRGTRQNIPKNKYLDNWRIEAGTHGRFGLYAPQVITDKPQRNGYSNTNIRLQPDELAQAGWFRDTEVVRRAVQSIADACARLQADVVIFRSPPEFSPSAQNRDRLHAFFTDIAPQDRFGATARVWEPTGLWELGPAARFAASHDLVLACDPLSNDPIDGSRWNPRSLPTSRVYFQITGMGRKQRFDEYALEPLFDLIDNYDKTWIVFSHTHKYPDAIRCHRLLAALATG